MDTTRTILALTIIVTTTIVIKQFISEESYWETPRLSAAIDNGSMARFLASPEEKETILNWVKAGAPKSKWPSISLIFEKRCADCHHSNAPFNMLVLDQYSSAVTATVVKPILIEKITGGTMGKYLDTFEEQQRLVAWVLSGADRSKWPVVEKILNDHCIQCHNPEGVQGIVSLESYGSVQQLTKPPKSKPKYLWLPGLLGLAALTILIFYHKITL